MSRLRLVAKQPAEPWAEPAQVLLRQLRAWRPLAYACREQDGRWLASCIVCGAHRGVRIDETRPGGRVLVRCRTGCTAEEIGQALDQAVDHADPWEHAERWAQLALELQHLAHDQAALIDTLTARPDAALAA